jgi:amino acid transporter
MSQEKKQEKKVHHKLGELAATAISGNDISSSVLYVSALAILWAGQYAWVTLTIVAVVLFFFRKIYGEVVGALPLNGGAYNALLNTTSKRMASLAAALTLLSYMATAVISGSEGMHYLADIVHALHTPTFAPLNYLFPTYVELSTVVLLGAFAMLVINGISESAKVAIAIFIFHLFSLVLLTSAIIIYLMNHGLEVFDANQTYLPQGGNLTKAIFLGFAASMLGISGFESSANFVEEQKDGVFPKTLRNMWIVVSIFNPLMAILAITIFPIETINNEYSTTLLSGMANVSAGSWLAWIVSIDAVLVLSGAVLTSFVGVSGLLERMTLDRILPQGLLKKNSKGTSYRIILMFFLLSISVLIITKGNVSLLAGVYTLSFLSVMGLFVVGNILLKMKRKKLPRPERASWYGLLIAMIGVGAALWGNIVMPPKVVEVTDHITGVVSTKTLPSNLSLFLPYFIVAMGFIVIMLNRIVILRSLLKMIKKVDRYVISTINVIISQEFVFFTKGDNLANLNKVMMYIRDNEHTRKIKIVTVLREGEKSHEKLAKDIEFLDREYPDIHIDYVEVTDTFGPKLIQKLSKQWNIPVNFMFIGSPGDRFPYRIEELGGVRLIM